MLKSALAEDVAAGLIKEEDVPKEDDWKLNQIPIYENLVPTQNDIEAWLVRRRKQELLDQFLAGDDNMNDL